FTSPDMDGTACLQVTGPVPEITALGHRLDAAARAVQMAQRQALAADESDLPFDVFGTVAETGRPMSLAALRYAILTRTAFGTEGIEVPESGFRINVTVPVMTLLGQSEAPGEVDGAHPIPPAMARDLVVNAPVFHRVLTDPVDGSFLPRAAKTYQVSRSMQELLRQIDPICAVPGCSTIVTTSGESDHIEEFDHQHPDRGGPTSPQNLHRLCYSHHRLKTLGLIDPIRDPNTGVTTWTARTRGRSRPLTETTRNTDLVTRELGDHLRVAWNSYLEREEDAHRRARGEALDEESEPAADPPSPAATLYDPENPPY
ncbi:HNH endonuclease signature motif containing protein, partial [Brachybacterium sp. Marseille-Q7125]|uniref:HNH endonuclease signature motif containing protein n=1 Tax=Brachybacterium sp. Marseille-Q7125 TaxID=2932815 RepID=UPI001FF56005